MSPRDSPWYATKALLTLLRHLQLSVIHESFDVIWENAPNTSISSKGAGEQWTIRPLSSAVVQRTEAAQQCCDPSKSCTPEDRQDTPPNAQGCVDIDEYAFYHRSLSAL